MSKDELIRLLLSSTTMSRPDAEKLASAIIAGASGKSGSHLAKINDNDITTIKQMLEDGYKFESVMHAAYNIQKQINEEISEEEEASKRILNIADRQVRLQKEINVELEKEEKLTQQSERLNDLKIRKIREGLTLQEEINKKILEWGVHNGHNIDMMSKGISEIKQGFNSIKSGVQQIADSSLKLVESWGKVDQAAANYTKAIGGSAAGMEQLRKSTIDFMHTNEIGAKYNTSMEELIKLQQNYNTQLGRSINLTNSQKENMAAMRAVMGDELSGQFTSSLATFGIDPDKVADISGKMFNESAKKGIVFEKYSKNFLNNIKMAQNYTFANGVEGLRRMAEHATKMNMDMNQTARFAEKVSTVEGALQTGAKLSVLGGTFSQFSNPLALMNMGLNDMESLQNTMEGIFSGKAYWDAENGELRMLSFDRQRLKAFSEATGTDYQSNLDSVFGIARRHSVEGQLTKFSGDSDSDKEMRELILNTAQLDKEGKAYVTIDGKQKNVNDVTENDKEKLQINKNSDSDNIRDIATTLRGWQDSIEGLKKQKEVAEANLAEIIGFGPLMKNIVQGMGSWGNLLAIPTLLGGITGILGGIGAIAGGILASINGFGNTIGGLNNGNGTALQQATNFSNTKFGKIVTGGGSKRAIGRIAKVGGYGKYVAKGAGIGLGLGAAGMAVDYITNKSYENKRKDGWYVTGKTVGAAAQGAAIGATIGSVIPVIGTGVGAAVGGLIGGGIGLYNSQDERRRDQLRRDKNIDLSPEEFSHSEVSEIYDYVMNGKRSSNGSLRLKLNDEGYTQRYPILSGFKRGGYTGDGNPNEVAGLVHKGEIVIPHSKVEPLKAGVNSLAISKVIPTSSNNNLNTVSKIKVEPLKIDVSGTIKLDLGNQQVNITANDLLKNQGFINELSKRLESQITMAYVKENRVNKFSQINL